ncbi:MAG: D-alanyl-D-alanine carboxypeptidase [Firmicutes bacterium]|nr:D-alanyl-D-alanine carboxypeptidase [Bacillota bacterium]
MPGTNFKRYTLISIILVLFLICYFSGAAEANIPSISADAAAVLDVCSGRVLYGHNMHKKRPIASTTKIMTAILTLERSNLADVVIVSKEAAETGGSSIWLEEGEKKTVEELLYGLMLTSGNDAAVALAEHLAGDTESFAQLMTNKAKEIGAFNTSFKNPHGLDHEEHYSTAYDMALIAAYALNTPGFLKVTTTKEKSISWNGRPWNRKLINQNKLLDLYPGATGVKTGWTTPAGRCFVGSARKGIQHIVTVVLDAPQMWEDTISLMDFAFSSFPLKKIISKNRKLIMVPLQGEDLNKLPLIAGSDFYYPLQSEEANKVKCNFCVKEQYRGPIQKGEEVGMLEILLHNNKIGEIPLLAAEEVKRVGFINLLLYWLKNIISRVKEVLTFG